MKTENTNYIPYIATAFSVLLGIAAVVLYNAADIKENLQPLNKTEICDAAAELASSTQELRVQGVSKEFLKNRVSSKLVTEPEAHLMALKVIDLEYSVQNVLPSVASEVARNMCMKGQL